MRKRPEILVLLLQLSAEGYLTYSNLINNLKHKLMLPIRLGKLQNMTMLELTAKIVGSGMEGTENPNTNIYISTSRPNKHIDDYSIEELQNIISNKKTEKLRHEAHVLRITNLELYNFIIDEHFYNKYSGPSHTDEYNYDSGY